MVDESNSAAAGEYPVELAQKQFNPQYVFRLPGNENLCYRFAIADKQVYHENVQCTSCFNIYRKHSKQKEKAKYPTGRKVINCTMESDPTIGHFDGCEPILYTETLKQYQPITEENNGENKLEFPLVKMAKNNSFMIIYRLKEYPSKCYRFCYNRKLGSSITIACATCYNIQMKTKLVWYRYNLREDGMSEDPRLHHLPGCEPFDFEELQLDYIPIGKDKSQQLISSWVSKDKKESVAADSQEPSNSTNINFDIRPKSGVRIVQTIKDVSFIYRIPDSEQCLRFDLTRYGTSSIAVACNNCKRIYADLRRKGSKDKMPAKSRKTDGLSMKDDPQLYHSPSCKTELYSEVVKNFMSMKQEHQMKPEYDYPLIKMRRIGEMQVVYQLENDPTKSLQFYSNQRKSKDSWSLKCAICQKLMNTFRQNKQAKRTPMEGKSYHVGGNFLHTRKIQENANCNIIGIYDLNKLGFLEDPLSGHIPECEPQCFKEVMKNRECVDGNTARSFMEGTYSRCGNVETCPNEQTDFPIIAVQKRHATCFVYKNPSYPGSAYVFHQLHHKDNSELVCSTCKILQSSDSTVVVRKSDGFSMEQDPAKNHLALCQGRWYKGIFQLKYLHREDGKKNPQRKYEFPLEKRQIKEISSALYRLKEDPSKCYRFQAQYFNFSSGILSLRCTACERIANKRNGDGKPTKCVYYKCTLSGFIDDPTKQHLEGCQPFEYDQFMKEFAPLQGKDVQDYFKHIESDDHMPDLNYSHGRRPKRKLTEDVEEQVTVSKNIKVEEEEMSEDTGYNSPVLNVEYSSDQDIQLNADNLGCSMEWNSGIIINSQSDMDEKDEKPDIREAKVEKTDSETKCEIPSDIFSRVYDVPFFIEDEADVTIEDRTVTMDFRRKVSAVGMESCSLRYSIDLPSSVDISTVQTTWKQGQMILTAERIL